jgi:subtilisin
MPIIIKKGVIPNPVKLFFHTLYYCKSLSTEELIMDYVKFARHLNHQIISSGQPARKHIIRFSNPVVFRRVLRKLHSLKVKMTGLSAIRHIQIINAIVCPLRSQARLSSFQGIRAIECDKKIIMHDYTGPGYHSPVNKPPDNGEPSIPWGVLKIKAPQVWRSSLGDRIKIGVIDTGIDYSHPDLKHAVSRGINLVSRMMPPNDDNGHGTHIAGTIAAWSNSNGIIGVAPKVAIYPVKAFDKEGSAYVSDIIFAIDWCVRNRINIINMSFGMKNRSQSVEAAIRNAYLNGVIVVASSGNDGKTGALDYPAQFPETIAVGATTQRGRIASFTNKSKRIDVYAPGDKIYSTWTGGGYNILSGTSMATSHVSGVIALMLAADPSLKPEAIRRILKRSSRPILSKKRGRSAAGEISALRAFRRLKL